MTENENWDELIVKILKAIYWKRITDKENAAIVSILEDTKLGNFDKAHSICDYLQIERRGNRSAIFDVLNADALLNELNKK